MSWDARNRERDCAGPKSYESGRKAAIGTRHSTLFRWKAQHAGVRFRYATPLSTPCVVYYAGVLAWPNSDIILNVVALDGNQRAPDALSAPVSTGRNWLVEMREPWEARGESVPVREYFEARSTKLARKDVEWTSATLYQVR
jgi:hypothetical protein